MKMKNKKKIARLLFPKVIKSLESDINFIQEIFEGLLQIEVKKLDRRKTYIWFLPNIRDEYIQFISDKVEMFEKNHNIGKLNIIVTNSESDNFKQKKCTNNKN